MEGFIKKIKRGLQDSGLGRLAENFVSLSVLQIINYILPLVTLPYLVRVLGAEKFGLVMFAVAFIQYFLMLTDYGFNLSATQEISVNREDKAKISEIFSSVMLIKGVLTFLSFAILAGMIIWIPKFRGDWLVYILTFGTVAGQALFPVWFFQGMERMKYITALNILAKVVFTVLIFVFIRAQSHYVYVPLFNSLGYLVSGILGIWMALSRFKVKPVFPGISIIYRYLKFSTQFFLSRVSVSLYSNSNSFIIGLALGNTMVGYYTAAEKLYIAMRMLYNPLTTALYPYMAKVKNIRLYRKIFGGATALNFLISLLVFILSGIIINIMYGDDFQMSANLLRIFSGIAVIIIPSILLGYPFLAALGYPRYANYSVLAASLFHIVVLLIMIPFINIYLVAGLTFFTELLVLTIRVYAVRKFRLWGTP
jgi:PST family polysaccharide transporter